METATELERIEELLVNLDQRLTLIIQPKLDELLEFKREMEQEMQGFIKDLKDSGAFEMFGAVGKMLG